MNIVNINANAKVNLSIDILGQRDDGYHLVNMIMQEIPLYDKIVIFKEDVVSGLRVDVLHEILEAKEKQEERRKYFERIGKPLPEPDIDEQITLTCTNPKLPVDRKNLAYRAARVMLDESDCKDKIAIHIRKKVPVGGGLGGGSADAAAVLKGMNELLGLNYPVDKLCELAKSLGSDVPFLVKGGTALATDTGTTLKTISPLNKGYILIVNPNIFLSTERVYTRLDSMEIPSDEHPDTTALIKALERGDLYFFAQNMKNVLEIPAFDLQPELKKLKAEIATSGAIGTLMSGSGSTVFGLYAARDLAWKAMRKFRSEGYFAIALDLC